MPAYCTGYRDQPVFLCTTALACWFRWFNDALGVRNHFYRFCEELIFTWIIHPLYFFKMDTNHREPTKHSCNHDRTGKPVLILFAYLLWHSPWQLFLRDHLIFINIPPGMEGRDLIFGCSSKKLKVQKYKSNPKHPTTRNHSKRLVVLLMEENPAPVYIGYCMYLKRIMYSKLCVYVVKYIYLHLNDKMHPLCASQVGTRSFQSL